MKIIKILRKRDNVMVDCLFDDKDYDWIIENNITLYIVNRKRDSSYDYAYVSKIHGQILKYGIAIHRLLFEKDRLNIKNKEIDHKDHNGLNNQRENLRICENGQNQANRRKTVKNTMSIYKGVTKSRDRWSVYINFNKRNINLGKYKSERLAGIAYNIKAKELYGEFACLNKIENITSEEINFVLNIINNVRKNKKYTYKIDFNGQSLSPKEWERKTGIKSSIILMRINNYGWNIGDALAIPTRIRTK